MEKAQKAQGHEKFWECDRDSCRYRVMTHDVKAEVSASMGPTSSR